MRNPSATSPSMNAACASQSSCCRIGRAASHPGPCIRVTAKFTMAGAYWPTLTSPRALVSVGQTSPLMNDAMLGTLREVHHPRDPEAVDAHTKLVAPGLLLHRHRDRPTGRELVEVAAECSVVAADAHRCTSHGLELHAGRRVSAHEHVARVGLQHHVHDLVRIG